MPEVPESRAPRTSLRTRLLIGCLAPLLAAAICQAVYTIAAERRTALDGLEEKARSLAALMVNVVGPSLAVGDPSAVQEGLAYIDKDADFSFAAALAPDGKVAGFRGSKEVRAGLLRQLKPVTQPALMRPDDLLVALYPLRPGTREVGTVIVGMATTKMRATITRMVVKTVFIASVGIAITLAVILLLSSAIVRRNRDLKLIMDNVGQGLLSVTPEGELLPEHSTILHSWFGPWRSGTPLWEYLRPTVPRAADWLRLLWDNVTADILPIDVALEQLPGRIQGGPNTYDFSYKPIFAGNRLVNILVVVSDVTVQVEQERAKVEQRELACIFQWMLKDKEGLLDFLSDADRLVQGITRGSSADIVALKREIHTLKGNCSFFGLQSIVSLCQDIENRLSDEGTELAAEDKDKLIAAWGRVQENRRQLFGIEELKQITIDPTEHAELLEAISKRVAHEDLSGLVNRWILERAKQRLGRFGEQARSLARRLNKGEIDVLVEANNVRLPPGSLGRFWSNFVHVIRNAVDHGLEPPDERAALGKSAAGSLQLRTLVRSNQFIVEIEDDGRGIDWRRLADRARASGLPVETRSDLVEAIFSDGISTKAEATDVSGRGVGMSAVREACAQTGGKVRVFSEPGEGTRFQFSWPSSVLDVGDAGPAADDVAVGVGGRSTSHETAHGAASERS